MIQLHQMHIIFVCNDAYPLLTHKVQVFVSSSFLECFDIPTGTRVFSTVGSTMEVQIAAAEVVAGTI